MCEGCLEWEGKITVTGLCYEDLVGILTTNGYDVRVSAIATSNYTNNSYVVEYKKTKREYNCYSMME